MERVAIMSFVLASILLFGARSWSKRALRTGVAPVFFALFVLEDVEKLHGEAESSTRGGG